MGAPDQFAKDHLVEKLPRIVPDPALREQREWLMRELMKDDPELHERVVKPEVDAAVQRRIETAVRQERDDAARDQARRSLRLVLSARRIALPPEQQARIDTQSDIEVLHRWVAQAATAATADEALA